MAYGSSAENKRAPAAALAKMGGKYGPSAGVSSAIRPRPRRPLWQRSGARQTHVELRSGLRLKLLQAHPVHRLDQRRAALLLVDGEHSKIGDEHIDNLRAGERQGAVFEEFRLFLGRVLHDHDDLLDTG